jgi:uncharacterized membrane protein YbaN (DUF454 family)
MENVFLLRMKKAVFIFLGMLSLALGTLGVVLPGLPTTPFVLLAAYLFARVSPRLHHWLLSRAWLGKYIRDYQQKGGISRRTRIYSMIIMWTTILISAWFYMPSPAGQMIFTVFGVTGTAFMGFIVPGQK